MKQKGIYSPILERLLAYQTQQPARFHVPGHKGGHFFPSSARDSFGAVLEIDVTELTGLDDLHNPQAIIAEAQRLAAETFHAEQTYFLVNGSTVGNLALLLSSLERGDQILVQRNSHKSVFHGLALAEVEAILLEPDVCPQLQVPIGLQIDTVEAALQQYPQVKALILTSPNYYGMITPTLQDIINMAHQHDCLVFIDEAHGAHFGQYQKLPSSAMQLGADASVQSTHKMLGSMTMSSMLHIQGSKIVRQDVEYVLRSLQSSSPSYPLLASLDLARTYVASIEAQEWEDMIGYVEQLRLELQQIGAYLITDLEMNQGQYLADPFKLTIQPKWNLSGFRLQQLLEQRDIYVELADPCNILLTLPLAPVPEWNRRLLDGLIQIAQEYEAELKQNMQQPVLLSKHQTLGLDGRHHAKHTDSTHEKKIKKIQMRKYKRKQLEEVSLRQGIGRTAAEMLVPYPPGIPLCLPNEIITVQMVEQILYLQKQGTYFQGKDRDFQTLLVVRE